MTNYSESRQLIIRSFEMNELTLVGAYILSTINRVAHIGMDLSFCFSGFSSGTSSTYSQLIMSWYVRHE